MGWTQIGINSVVYTGAEIAKLANEELRTTYADLPKIVASVGTTIVALSVLSELTNNLSKKTKLALDAVSIYLTVEGIKAYLKTNDVVSKRAAIIQKIIDNGYGRMCVMNQVMQYDSASGNSQTWKTVITYSYLNY